MKTKMLTLCALFLSVTTGGLSAAVWDAYGGTYNNWPTSWTALSALNDPNDGKTVQRLDFVGDATDPGGYWASDNNYVYFRIRVQDGAAATPTSKWGDNLVVLIDKNGDALHDYGIAWDTKGGANHGLEMTLPYMTGTSWGTTRLQDLDNNMGAKISPPDFGASNGDGYLRIVEGQTTSNFGTTSFIDIAASWSYLGANTTLAPGQTWHLQFGSINNATDHANIDYDVAGGHNPGDTGLTWAGSITPVPEPAASAAVLGIVSLATAGILRGAYRIRRS